MELRQLRYFVTLAEELHFGRAAAREHIVQSALSQRLQRLERELGVILLERTTHHVQLSAAGAAFLIDARQILAHVERAATAAQRAAQSTPSLRVGVVDASYDSMPLILHEVQQQHADLEIHQVEIGVPEQFQRLVDGRLDVGLGRASLAPSTVASELFRLDPLGVLVAEGHPLAMQAEIPVATLAAEPLLLSEEERAPEFNQFVIELCRSVGFVPTLYRGTVGQHPGLGRSRRAAALCALRTVLVLADPRRDRVAAAGRSLVALSLVGVVAGRRLLGACQLACPRRPHAVPAARLAGTAGSELSAARACYRRS